MVKGLFQRRRSESIVEFDGIRFPIRALEILLAQSASAEVRRRYEAKGDIFQAIRSNRAFQQEFLKSYVQANRNFFELMRPHLPHQCRRVLDIGCGIGLLDLFIYRETVGPKPKFYLYDKSVNVHELAMGGAIAPTGYNERYMFTTSLACSADFLRLNGVSDSDIQLCEVDSWNIQQGAPYDLVFSRKSWGFHYPISEYLLDVTTSVHSESVVITDIRNAQGSEEAIAHYFSEMKELDRGRKSSMVLFSNCRQSL